MEKHKPKITKQDLKTPDAFILNMSRFGEWAFENRMSLIGVVILIALIAIVWGAVGMYNSHNEDLAQESLYKAEKIMQAEDANFEPTTPPADAKKAGAKDSDKKSEAPKAVRTGQLETDYKDAVPALQAVVKDHPGTKASVVAALDLAHLYYDYKMYDQELQVLTTVMGAAKHPVVRALVQDNLGLAYEAKGDCNKAIEEWKAIGNDRSESAFSGKSLINSALCYEKLNQPDKALADYQRFDEAEKELNTLRKSLAVEYGLNPNLPLEEQKPNLVQKYERALSGNERYQELGGLLSDQDSVRAAKKYIKLLKRGQS